MSGSEPTLTESPVPLALARLQTRPGRLPRGLRTHRPSLPLASLQESIDEGPRRFSEESFAADTDDDELFVEAVVVDTSSPSSSNGRRNSAATFAERYRKLTEFDGPPPDLPRRASLAVPVEVDGYGPSDKGRRRSWAARLQLERKKRRKSGGNDTDEEGDTPTYIRQKRPSWWNVFVPDNMLKNRSRRASQQLSRSAESIDQSYKRSKSRSVDHGFAAPFDLESLRSKVEGRFDAVHKDEDEHTKRLPPPPPIKTMTYTVRDRDTLTSLAARFDTTPSELTKINRLATQFIFPGQTLLVPDKRKDGDKDSDGPSESGDSTSESTQGTSEPAQEKEILDSLRPVSPEEPASSAPQRFLKINVRHITDGQGVVSGVLLVTPNAVMFDPNVSDTLVMEHGPESYGVIAPMEYVVNAAIFYDIAHMRTHGPDHNAHKAEQAEIYYMNKSDHSPGKDSLLVKDETFPELQAAGEAGESQPPGGEPGGEAGPRPPSVDTEERGGGAFPKAFERDLVTPTPLHQQTTEERRKSLLDQHWAIPSKDRMSIDQGSEVSSSVDHGKEESLEASVAEGSEAEGVGGGGGLEGEAGEGEGEGDAAHLVKLSYHDSGIDIRDPLLHVNTANTKKELCNICHEIDTIYELPEMDVSLYEWHCDTAYENKFLNCFAVCHDVDMMSCSTDEVYSDADIVLSADWVPPVCLPRAEPPLSAPPLGENERARKPAAVSFSLDGSQKEDPSKPDKKNKMLKRLSYPLSWVEGLTGEGAGAGSPADSLPSSADTHNTSVFSKVFNSSPMNLVEFGTGLFLSKTPSEEGPGDGRSSLGGFGRSHAKPAGAPQPRLDYRSMVSVDDMPDLFASFDKLIPRPARASEDPPLYLRLRMGKPAGRPLPRSTPLMSYGRKRMKPEYWFGIPRNRVDDLFKFLTHWVPERYGALRDVTAHGYELIDSDTEWDDDDVKPGHKERIGSSGDVSDITKESWELLKAPYVKIYSIMKSQAEALGDSLGEEPQPEVLSMSDELRRALYSSGASLDMEFSPPDLIGTSEIFTMDHREKLCSVLPARAQGYMWQLTFSTSQHGFSLASMYRKMQRVDSPVLLVIQDTDNNVFGALTSCAFRPSEHFYGTGESLLFSFQRTEELPRSQEDAGGDDKDIKEDQVMPLKTKFKYWGWTGDNMYFIRGSNDNLSIGAGDGRFGVWLDGDLYLGRTQRCTTYGNEPLSTREDFVVKICECWTFI